MKAFFLLSFYTFIFLFTKSFSLLLFFSFFLLLFFSNSLLLEFIFSNFLFLLLFKLLLFSLFFLGQNGSWIHWLTGLFVFIFFSIFCWLGLYFFLLRFLLFTFLIGVNLCSSLKFLFYIRRGVLSLFFLSGFFILLFQFFPLCFR